MPFTLLTLAVGVAVAVLAGGRARHLGGRRFRLCSLLLVGIALQALLHWGGVPAPFALLVASYACVLAFALLNLHLRGMWMVALGFALNAVVITVNEGMPVSPTAVNALVAESHDGEGGVPVASFGTDAVYHLQGPSDRLTALGDVIPVPPLRQILSFGDLVLAVGTVDVLVHLMRPPRRRRTPSRDVVAAER